MQRERLTAKTFIQRAIEIHGDKYDYSKTKYIKAKEPVIITCKKHGDFTQRPQDHILKACGCPKCKGEKVIEVHSYTFNKFLELAREKYGNKYDYSKANYINYETPITIICPIHGEFSTVPRIHLQAITGCPKCGREKANKSESSNTEEFIKKASKIHFNKYNYSKVNYINNNTKVEIICPEHGSFLQIPANHLSGQGCPKCRLVNQTRLYNKLKRSFLDEEIIFEANNKTVSWLNTQRFDIYFPKYNIAVEYNGKQHYIPVEYFGGQLKFEIQQEQDELKRQKCKDNNCTLFEIKYDYNDEDYQELVNNIQEIINNYNEN